MKKAQFAMEYMLVVAFSVVLMIPLVGYLYTGYDDMQQDVNVEHMAEVAREISFQAEKIYYQGPNSRTTINAYFPRGVEFANISSFETTNYGGVEFQIQGFKGTIFRTINAKICGDYTLPTFSGPHNIEIIANNSGCLIIQEQEEQQD